MKNLDDLKLIERLDQGGMRHILAGFTAQCQQAFGLGKEFLFSLDAKPLKNIVFCGMGGSAIGAEVASFYLRNELRLVTLVNRDYTLPAFVDEQSLVILSSYSGNTEETLSAYAQAKKAKAQMMVISSGGKITELADEDHVARLLIPPGFPPRAALAYLCFPLLAILEKLSLIKNQDQAQEETVALLAGLEKKYLGVGVKGDSNPAKKLARRLFNNFCVIYAANTGLGACACRWRGQLAENSKALSSMHLLPEMNHNEIVGWQHPEKLLKRFVAVFLRDHEDHPQVKKRIEVSKEILEKQGIAVEEISSMGESLLARIFSLIYTGDFVSFYLAILNQEDPTPVKRIDYLKNRLKELE